MHTDKEYKDRFAQEVIELHRFFEDWFTGKCDNSIRVFEDRLTSRIHGDFMLVLPAGILFKGEDFWPELYRAHGSNPDFGISIQSVQLCDSSHEPVFIVTYEEWQRNAINSQPANNGRMTTATFIQSDNPPKQLSWLHVHETWLPDVVIDAASFDWQD